MEGSIKKLSRSSLEIVIQVNAVLIAIMIKCAKWLVYANTVTYTIYIHIEMVSYMIVHVHVYLDNLES